MDNDGLETILFYQRQELMAAESSESDLDLAYRLQIEEALAASAALQPSSSAAAAAAAPPPPRSSSPPTKEFVSAISLQSHELDRFHQEKADAELSRRESIRLAANLRVQSHDAQFAREIASMPESEWEHRGDEFQQPMKQGEERPVRIYFKGIECDVEVKGKVVQLAAIGVAICDERDAVLLQISRPAAEVVNNREAMETNALIEALREAVVLGVKKVQVFMDFKVLYMHILDRWRVRQRKIANIIDNAKVLMRGFQECDLFWVPRSEIKYAFKLARDAIDSQIRQKVEFVGKNVKETCTICLEDNEPLQMFTIDECLHCFCFSCMKQHVEIKLLNGVLPGCPHEGCKIRLNVESCRKFLSSKLLNIMTQRIKEESIPVTQKIYCPYPKCSALMSVNDAIKPQVESSSTNPASDSSGLRKCIQCGGSFCIRCKVPWHDRMSCYDYNQSNSQRQREELKLKALARQKLWRQCIKCSHMIELAEGCYHMTCRCGYEFCYTCGKEWKNKKATCDCPLWDEQNIVHDYYSDDDSDYHDDDRDEYDSDDDIRENFYNPVRRYYNAAPF